MENYQILDHDVFHDEDKSIEIPLTSIFKFCLFGIVSFSTYPLWWAYKAWKFYKLNDNSDISPAGRTVFSIFYYIDLFERTLQFAKKYGYTNSYASVGLFVAVIGMNLCANAEGSLISILAYFAFVPIIPVVKAFNFAVQAHPHYNGIEETKFSTRQILLLILGSILLIFTIIGSISPDESEVLLQSS